MINYLSTTTVNFTLIDLLFCCTSFAMGVQGDMIGLGAFCAWVMLGYYYEEGRDG
jgi:hypothetical protein